MLYILVRRLVVLQRLPSQCIKISHCSKLGLRSVGAADSDIQTREHKNSLQDRRRLGGEESESELWLRCVASDNEAHQSGNISAFEDEYGNPILPTGQLTNSIPLRMLKQRATGEDAHYFVDWRRIKFQGGRGGDGMISFLSMFANPEAGPDGGDGGNGGHVILKADPCVKSLANVHSLYFGQNGAKGMSRDMTGKSGEHIYVPVPLGTLVKVEEQLTTDDVQAALPSTLQTSTLSSSSLQTKKKLDGKEAHDAYLFGRARYKLIADLSEEGSMFIAAKGGAGGKGNHFFLTNENRKPRVAEVGANGEGNVFILEMKTIAHVGLIGFPNVGKSTLLRSISRARPRVASYPFTTLRPHVGIVHFNDHKQLVVADLPGLIEGAHLNRGLGISFLKHLERCVCLIYVVDLGRQDVVEQFCILKKELEGYKPGLSKRPHAIVGNKVDLPNAQAHLELLRAYIQQNTPENTIPLPIIPMSAKFGTNLVEYLKHIRGMYDLYNQPERNEPGFEWTS